MRLKPDLEASLQRIEAFWQRELLDRPLVQFRLDRPRQEQIPPPPSRHSSPTDLWLDAEYQAELALAELSNQLFLGDSLPVAWPNLGPDFFAALYGCPLTFGEYGTSWSHPILQDWAQADQLSLDWEHPYLQKIEEMTEALLTIGEGIFLTGLTDLHPGGDCLAALRGAQQLALDLVENPTAVKRLLKHLEQDFQALYLRLYRRLRLTGLPISTWTPLACWESWYLPSNDFSALISPTMFAEFFLPGIIEECRFWEHSLYHLDGPAALRHLELLLAVPELDAVQFVPPPQDERFLSWVDVYQRIQQQGKGLQVTCRLEEIPQVMDALRPQGLYLVVKGVDSIESAEHLLSTLERWAIRGYH